MKKIDCSYGGGLDTLLYSAKLRKVFSYHNDRDREELHDSYGGHQYYTSRSGLSGAGFLRPVPSQDDLIEIGGYRTDARTAPCPRSVKIGGYVYDVCAPYTKEGGVDRAKPIVVSRGHQVCMIQHADLSQVDSIYNNNISSGWRAIEIPAWDRYGEECPIHLTIHGRGANALAFASVNQKLEPQKWHIDLQANTDADDDFALRQLGWLRCLDGGERHGWLHVSRRGYFDGFADEDPRDMFNDMPGGWVADEDIYMWHQRRGDSVYMFYIEYDKGTFKNGVEYELEVDVIDFYAQPQQHWRELLQRAVAGKKAAIAEYASRIAADAASRDLAAKSVMEILRQNPAMEFTRKDALNQGLCRVGTNRWLRDHGIEARDDFETRTAGELLLLPHIFSMCNDTRFEQVVRTKLMDLASVEDSE